MRGGALRVVALPAPSSIHHPPRITMNSIRFVAACCIWLALCCPTWAVVTYYVRTTGNDANAGTSAAAAFKTIDKGCNTAHAGDTIYVGAGIYATADATPTNSGTAVAPINLLADTTGAFTGDAGVVEFRKQVNL